MCIADRHLSGVNHELISGVKERLCVHGICNSAVFTVAIGPRGSRVTGAFIFERDINGVAAFGFHNRQSSFGLAPNLDYLNRGICATCSIYSYEGHIVLHILGAQRLKRVCWVQGIRSRAIAEVPGR